MTTLSGCARWGTQIDVQILREGNDRAGRVASYLGKYATKSSSEDPRLDARVFSLDDLEARNLPAHLHSMVATALELGADPALQDLRLARHAHRLGFGGHFLTKSRGYSTTFGALRQARVDWRQARRLGSEQTESEGHWRAIGAGWANQGEELFAAAQQRQRAEERREVMAECGTPEASKSFRRGQTAAGGAAARARLRCDHLALGTPRPCTPAASFE